MMIMTTSSIQLLLVLLLGLVSILESFQQPIIFRAHPRHIILKAIDWNGEVVPEDGRIKGCEILPISETEFTIKIDGNEADLGKFGAAVYKKITTDAKKQRFQGFRPGTIPPHLLPAYKAFAMDEVAREATLEAMQQNNIRPFDSARQEMMIEQVSIPSKSTTKGKKKKDTKKIDSQDMDETTTIPWETYSTMKDALTAGWEPGQSFSFQATNCKGQKVEPVSTEKTVLPNPLSVNNLG
jgi:hypothetical protein